VLQGLSLLYDPDNNTLVSKSVINDDFLHSFDHRMILISITNTVIFEEFYSNFQSILDSKFQFISDTHLKQYSFECDNSIISVGIIFIFHSKDCKSNYFKHIDLEEI
jgi:hypothetical protein